jgi:hypothetical protein
LCKVAQARSKEDRLNGLRPNNQTVWEPSGGFQELPKSGSVDAAVAKSCDHKHLDQTNSIVLSIVHGIHEAYYILVLSGSVTRRR